MTRLLESNLRDIGLEAAQSVVGTGKVEQVEVVTGHDSSDRPAYFFSFLIDHDRDRKRAALVRTRLAQNIRDRLIARGDGRVTRSFEFSAEATGRGARVLDPSELLDVARLLAAANANPAPPEGQLRRAISTAYYALFHAVLRAGTQRFTGPGHEAEPALSGLQSQANENGMHTPGRSAACAESTAPATASDCQPGSARFRKRIRRPSRGSPSG